MLKMLRKLLLTVFVLALIIGAAMAYFLSDTENIKAQLNTQLSAASGYEVDIQGDLKWQILPRLGIAVANVKVRDDETQIHIGKLQIGLSLTEITKPPETWTLARLILSEVRVKDADFRLQSFDLRDFSLGNASPFKAQLVFLEAPEPSKVRPGSQPVNIDGEIIYRLLPSKIDAEKTLSDLTLVTADIETAVDDTPLSGTCQGTLTEVDGNQPSTDTLNAYSSKLDCTSSAFTLNSLTWPESKSTIRLAKGRLDAELLAEKGSVDIQKLKETVTVISALINQENYAAGWPDVMQYQQLAVNGSLQNGRVNLYGTLDNLAVAMAGTLEQSTGELDLSGDLTIAEAAPEHLISVGNAIVDLPLPFNCRGKASSPDCGPDLDAATFLAKELVKRRVQDEVESTIIDEIQDKLPEEFRDAAKQLLQLNLFKD